MLWTNEVRVAEDRGPFSLHVSNKKGKARLYVTDKSGDTTWEGPKSFTINDEISEPIIKRLAISRGKLVSNGWFLLFL